MSHKVFKNPPRYRYLDALTSGGQGGVYIVFDEETGERRVMKLERHTDAEREQLAAGYLPHSRRPDFFLHPLAFAEIPNSNQTALVLPYVNGADVWALMTSKKYKNDFHALLQREGNLETFLSNVCLAVAVAHDVGVVHSDLSYSNIMVTQEGKTLKPIIIDFGFASAMCYRVRNVASKPPSRYDPRMYQGISFPAWEADVYSLGYMILWMYKLLNIEAPEDVAKHMMHAQNKRWKAAECARFFRKLVSNT